jgi:hypothetical protein
MPKSEEKVLSFEIDEIDKGEQLVVVLIKEKFCRALGLGLVRECENPALKAMGHQILNAGQILRGAPVGDFPALADLVVEGDAPEVENTADVAVVG